MLRLERRSVGSWERLKMMRPITKSPSSATFAHFPPELPSSSKSVYQYAPITPPFPSELVSAKSILSGTQFN
ncbi:hypothetical protein TNCV_2514921 [Trichonephila clavipes]|nr:hypothetical protein TNCV_2514921 [Trichonephila clavipes]